MGELKWFRTGELSSRIAIRRKWYRKVNSRIEQLGASAVGHLVASILLEEDNSYTGLVLVFETHDNRENDK
jgi:hypothetical protein